MAKPLKKGIRVLFAASSGSLQGLVQSSQAEKAGTFLVEMFVVGALLVRRQPVGPGQRISERAGVSAGDASDQPGGG